MHVVTMIIVPLEYDCKNSNILCQLCFRCQTYLTFRLLLCSTNRFIVIVLPMITLVTIWRQKVLKNHTRPIYHRYGSLLLKLLANLSNIFILFHVPLNSNFVISGLSLFYISSYLYSCKMGNQVEFIKVS